MGCDIHLSIEYRTKQDRPWTLLSTPIPDRYEPGGTTDLLSDILLDGRSYALFGILAGVRMRDGDPISEPRGLPNDMSVELEKRIKADETWLGDHSFSWLTFREIHEHSRFWEIKEIYPLWFWMIKGVVEETGWLLKGYEFRVVFGFDS